MSVDLRTEINDCDDDGTTFTTDGGALGTVSLAGQFYEGTAAVEAQHSNADEALYTTTNSAGTALNLDLSDQTVYILLKDSLVSSYTNGGVQILLGDGTDRIGYDVGGNDAKGMPIGPFFNVYKLDGSAASATPGGFTTYAGTEANLTFTAISAVGVGTLHAAKAQGNVANLSLDRMTRHANGSYGLRINGGTVGTPETMADVAADDETNGWGMVSNPLGDQYLFIAPTEWGNPAATADVYFSAADEQWFWIGDNGGGRAVGATHFPFRFVGNATDTIDITWSSLVIVNTGTRAEFDISDANVDAIDFDNVTFNTVGAITFPANDVNKTFDILVFNDCAQVNPDDTTGTNWTFNGTTDANGAIILDTAGNGDNLTDVAFVSDGTGHAVYITATGTYDFNNWTFSGYGADTTTDAAVYNNSGGAVTINILGGDTPTVRNGAGASTTLNNSVTVLVDGMVEGTSVVVLADETAGTITSGFVLGEGFADSNGEYSFSLNYEGAFGTGLDVIVRARNQNYPLAALVSDNGVYTDITEGINARNAARVAAFDKLLQNTATTTHVVPLPSAQIGDLYAIMMTVIASTTITVPAGWTARANVAQTPVRHYGLFRTVDGTEGSSVSITSSASTPSASHVFRIADWEGSTTIDANNVYVNTPVTGTNSIIDANNIVPGWPSLAIQALSWGDDGSNLLQQAGTTSGISVYSQRWDETTGGSNNTASIATGLAYINNIGLQKAYGITNADRWQLGSAQPHIGQGYAVASDNTYELVFPDPTTANEDAFIMGYWEQFGGARFTLPWSGSYTGGSPIWQYWNGSSWSNLTIIKDDTLALDTYGESSVRWQVPTNWATTTINSLGPYYYIRLFVPTGVTVNSVPEAESIKLDGTRYLPFEARRTITSNGLTVTAQQTVDSVSILGNSVT